MGYVPICKICKNAYVTHSLSGYHITCKFDRNDYSFSSKGACSLFKLSEDVDIPEDFLTEEEMYV